MRDESQTKCLSRDETGFEEFNTDGTLIVGTSDGVPSDMKATWRIRGNTVERTYTAPFAGTATVRDQIRFEGNRMILWNTEMKQGFIYSRHGQDVHDQPTPITDGTSIESQINGVRFRIAPPVDYHEIRRTNYRVGWGPVRAGGIEFTVSVTEICSGDEERIVRETIAPRTISFTAFRCIDGRDFRCDVERGDEQPLREIDEQHGLAVCRSLEVI